MRAIKILIMLFGSGLTALASVSLDYRVYEDVGKEKEAIIQAGAEHLYGSFMRTRNATGLFKENIYSFDGSGKVNLILQTATDEDLAGIAAEDLVTAFIENFGFGYCVRISRDRLKNEEILLPSLIWKTDIGYMAISLSFDGTQMDSAYVRCINNEEYEKYLNSPDNNIISYEQLNSVQLEVLSHFNMLTAKCSLQVLKEKGVGEVP